MDVNGIPVEVIATGSTGNAVLVGNNILIDCGVPYLQIKKHVPQISIVIISHAHSDHMRGSTIRRLAKERPSIRWAVGEFLVGDLLSFGVKPYMIDVLNPGTAYDYGAFLVKPIPLHHDVPNYGFIIGLTNPMKKVFYAVDTQNLDDVECHGADLYLIESNYTESDLNRRREETIASGGFWYSPEKRHLSFEQAVEWLEENKGPESQWMFIHGHGGEEQCEGL